MANVAIHQTGTRPGPRSQVVWHAGLPTLAMVGLIGSYLVEERTFVLALLAFSLALLFIWAARIIATHKSVEGRSKGLDAIKSFCEEDMLATLMVSLEGEILWENQAARKQFDNFVSPEKTVASFLSEHLLSAGPIVRRLAKLAEQEGAHKESLVGLQGQIHVHVQALEMCHLWRFEINPPTALVDASEGAMLTLGRNGTVLFMNQSAKTLIGERIKNVDRLFTSGFPRSGQIQKMKTSLGLVSVKVEERKLKAQRSHLFLTPVGDDIGSHSHAISDLPIPILHLKLNGKIEHANMAALTLLGYSDLVECCLTDIFDSDGVLIDDWIVAANSVGASIDAEFLRVKGAKKETFVQVALKRIDRNSNPRLVAILTDATKLKSLEAQFVQSQKMQAIGQLAGGVAHDFNNLLTAISGHCDLMLLRHDPGDQDYADLMQVHQNANRAAGLVSQLLAFSRKQTLQLEHLDLRNTLSDLTHLLNRLVGETVSLTLSHDPVLRTVRADKRQLEQVIMNLVVNARDAMPDGGEIAIQTESMILTAPLRRDRVTVPIGDYIVVRVRDEGVGIDDEALQKIFEPFYTTKRVGEGTGLGLSTAYGIVKQTGGFIFADSKLGQGTCFSLFFPASEEKESTQNRSIEYRPPNSNELCSGVVLLVEDEAPVRAFASRALSMQGFDVIEADSAEQALKLLEDASLQVDVFVTDVVMPGMDGPTWVEHALKERPNVNVVFISGYAEGAFQGKNPQFYKSVFLPKPFSLAELTSTVQGQVMT